MNEERKRILQMLADGTITQEQAGELLEVLEDQPVAAGMYAGAPWPQWEPKSRNRGVHYGVLDRVAEARDHGVTSEYVREMGELGYGALNLKDLIKLRDHGVKPSYIREMREFELGDLSIQEVVKLHDHGVDPTFVRDMRDLGFGGMSARELCSLRDHGVSIEFMREMRDLGLLDLTPEQVVEMRVDCTSAANVEVVAPEESRPEVER